MSRIMGAASLATLLLLGLLTAVALAQFEIPPTGSNALIQTTGPNAGLNIGDWYSHATQGNGPHNFSLTVPCSVDPSEPLTLELFDPEIFYSGGTDIDEIRNAANNGTNNNAFASDASFELLAPDNSVVSSTTYSPSAATSEVWNNFVTFDTGTFGCGTYTLRSSSADNDDNAWRLRLTPDDPDGIPYSGDEIIPGAFQTSFQHGGTGVSCQNFYYFVQATASITLNNFDLDYPFFSNTTVTHIPPTGGNVTGTASGGTVWNNGGTASNRGGDVIPNPVSGWWHTELCTDEGNQYIFEPQGRVYYFAQPSAPAMAVSKDDGQTYVTPGGVLNYTITFTNTSDQTANPGPALNVILVDQIPLSTTYDSCAIAPPFNASGTCSYSNGQVTFALNDQVVKPGVSGTVQVGLQVGLDASGTLANSVALTYDDILGNAYPPETADDFTIVPSLDLQLTKTNNQDIAEPGQTVTYVLTIDNIGGVIATGVTITDTLPTNTTFVGASHGGTESGGFVTWSVTDLDVGNSITRSVTLTLDNPMPPGVTTIANNASVGDDGSHGPDINPDNNGDQDEDPILLPKVEPLLTKIVTPAQTYPGQLVDFAITISNPSNPSEAPATSVVLTEALPVELDYVTHTVASNLPGFSGSSIVTQNSVDTSGHPSGITETIASTITVNSATLELDETVTLNITTRVNDLAAPQPLIITNTATLDFAEGQSQSAQAAVEVLAEPIDPSPPPNPSSPQGDYNDDNDDDDDDQLPTGNSGNQPTTANPSSDPPTTTLPVTLLPETGQTETGTIMRGMLLLTLLLGLGIGFRYMKQRLKI